MKMKPIRLKFSGLQSYREEQEIDFQNVGDLGIFGIFGPTGAGKSSILDAITLALYGNVERAPNGIRGIINHFEEEISVSFEFVLGNHRYLAERNYKLNKNNMGISNRLSRLIKISDEEEVLADKATHMNEKVRELLGMEFKDFTRAVIIPQNKFDEFLKLTEGERTEMLEKIFGLEEYGEGLSNKVKNLEKNLAKEYESNTKIMLELGNVSEEVLKQAKIDLETKQKEVAKKKKEELELEIKIKDMEERKKLHQEIQKLKKQKEILDLEAPEIKNEKERLKYAKRAEVFKNPLNNIKELEEEIKKEENTLNKEKKEEEEIDNVINITQGKLEKVKEYEIELKKLKEEELPKITLATNYEEEWDRLKKEAEGTTKAIKKETDELKIVESEIEKKIKDLKREEEIVLRFKKQKQKMENILYCRKEVSEAILLLQSVESEEKQLKHTSKQLNDKLAALQQEERKFKKLFSEKLFLDTDYKEKIELQDYMELVDKKIKKEGKKLESVEAEWDNIIDNNMARALALKLKTGEACQVCGSTHHPKLYIESEDVEDTVIEEARAKCDLVKKEIEDLRNWQQELNIQYTVYNNLKKDIISYYKPMVANKTADLKNVETKFCEALGELQKKVNEISNTFVVSDENNLRILQKRLEKAEDEYQQVNKDINDKEASIQKLNQIIMNIKEKSGNIKSDIRVNQDMLIKHQQRLEELKQEKISLIGDISSKNFEKELRKRINYLEKEIKETQDFWEINNKKKQEIQQKINILNSTLEKSKKYFDSLEKNLEEDLKNKGFDDIHQALDSMIKEDIQKNIETKINIYEESLNHVSKTLESLEEKAKEKDFDEEEFNKIKKTYSEVSTTYNDVMKEEGALENNLKILKEKQKRCRELQEENQEIGEKKEVVSTLYNLLRGRKFVKFLAEEHMRDMAIEASIKLGELTGQRYGLELDEKGNFIMQDDYSNGEGRLVTSLSGGETFLTSLALALALSSKIQLRGKPLGLFFLDEGFGTLDNEKLELVMNTLEKLQKDERIVGVISHVEEMKSRMPRYIEVIPSQANGVGSKVIIKHN